MGLMDKLFGTTKEQRKQKREEQEKLKKALKYQEELAYYREKGRQARLKGQRKARKEAKPLGQRIGNILEGMGRVSASMDRYAENMVFGTEPAPRKKTRKRKSTKKRKRKPKQHDPWDLW